MRQRRGGHGCTALGNDVYVIGGGTGGPSAMIDTVRSRLSVDWISGPGNTPSNTASRAKGLGSSIEPPSTMLNILWYQHQSIMLLAGGEVRRAHEHLDPGRQPGGTSGICGRASPGGRHLLLRRSDRNQWRNGAALLSLSVCMLFTFRLKPLSIKEHA